LLVHTLADCAVGTVSSDHNFTLIIAVVRCLDGDPIFILGNVKHTLTKVDFVRWDLLEDQVVKLWASDDVLAISSAMNVEQGNLCKFTNSFGNPTSNSTRSYEKGATNVQFFNRSVVGGLVKLQRLLESLCMSAILANG